MIGTAMATRRPDGTRKIHGEVLNTRAKAKAVAVAEGARGAFYEKIGELYGDGEKGANELLKRAKIARSIASAKLLPPTGAPINKPERVASPTVPGATQEVLRVSDTIHGMVKRRQIDEREYQAGERYRTAYQRLYSVMGGTMDFERARGGGVPGQAPGVAYLNAAEDCRTAKLKLYAKDFAVVHRVCALGMSIEEAAFNLPDQYERDGAERPTRAAREECGRKLRSGLAELADLWFPMKAGTGSKIRGVVYERAEVTDAMEAPKASRVVHATSRKVFRSGG